MENKRAVSWGIVCSALFGLLALVAIMSASDDGWLDAVLNIVFWPVSALLTLIGSIFQNLDIHLIGRPIYIGYVLVLGYFTGYYLNKLFSKIKRKGNSQLYQLRNRAVGWGLGASALIGIPFMIYVFSGARISWLDSGIQIIAMPVPYGLILVGIIFPNLELHFISGPAYIIYYWLLGFFTGYFVYKLRGRIMRKRGEHRR